MKPLIAAALLLTACAHNAPAPKPDIVNCTAAPQWALGDGQGIHVCFARDGGVWWVGKPLPPPPTPQPEPAKKPKVKKYKTGSTSGATDALQDLERATKP